MTENMESNNNAPAPAPSQAAPAAAVTDNGSASQDSFLTEDNSKETPAMNSNGNAVATGEGDDNLSPISDSELDDDGTNDTTDARPVSPVVPEAEAISQSNDEGGAVAEKEAVVNDNEGTTQDEEGDTNTGDVEMKDAGDEESTQDETRAADKDADQENNNSEGATGDEPVPPVAAAEEPMEVDETDKGMKGAGPEGDETSQTNPEEDSTTNISGADLATNTEEAHFQSVAENDTPAHDASIGESSNQPETDMLNDSAAGDAMQQGGETEGDAAATEQQVQTEPEQPESTPEVDASEKNVQEIEIGTFRDVTVTTDEILTRAAYDKILEETHKNIILETALKTPEIPLPPSRTTVPENEIREMDDDERLAPEMACKPCLHCLEEKPAIYKMMRTDQDQTQTDFFCSSFCTEEFKSESSLCDVLVIKSKRTTVMRHPLPDFQDCIACEKKDVTCRFKFSSGDETKYLCDEQCLDKFTDKDYEKYSIHLSWFDVVPAGNVEGTATCCKCRVENKVCTLKLRQLGSVDNSYLLCDAACRDAILNGLPVDAQPKKAEFVLHLDDLDEAILDDDNPLPRSSADAERLKQAQEETITRKCHNCASEIEEAGLSNVHWQFNDFCCGDCLFEFHKKNLADEVASAAGPLIGKCATCTEEMAVDDKVGRLMILHGQETKTFCNESCLVRFKDTHRVCLSCRKSVVKDSPPPAQSDWDELMSTSTAEESKFCSDSCSKRFDRTIARIKLATGTDTTVLCHVCNHVKQIAVTCQVNNKVISLCSQACLYAFKFANSVDPQSCRTCNRFFERSPQRKFTIYSFSGDTCEAYSFCTRSCRDLYVIRDALVNVAPCSWCGIKKRECDLMRLRPFGDTYKPALVCSVECERLLRFVVEQRNERLKDTWSCTFCQKSADFDVQRRLILLPALVGDSSSWRSFCSSKCARSSVGEDLLFESKFEESMRRLTKEALTNLVENLLKPRPTLSVRDGASLQALTNGDSSDDDRGGGETYEGVHYEDYNSGHMSPPPVQPQRQQPRGRGRPKAIPQIKIRTEPALIPRKSAPAPVPEIRTQILTVGPPPTVVRNMATMCRPKTESRGTMARPKKISVECQTEPHLERKYYIPIPVPIYVPTPLPMYSLPTPVPVPIAIPIPVPVFIPTTRNSAEGIMKEIKKIQDKMPADPYEAELLLMAEMVADDAVKSDDSDSDDDRPLKSLVHNHHGMAAVPEYHHLGSHAVAAHATVGGAGGQGTGMEGEDMLMMALKMAYDGEPQTDLEATMQANTITQAPHDVHQHHHQTQYDQYGMPTQQHHQDAYNMSMGNHQQQQQQGHSLLLLESPQQMQQQQQQQETRGRKRGSGRGAVGARATAQPAAVIQPPPNKRGRNRSPQNNTYNTEQHQREMERAESNMCLKYTFGVNAWKQWVTSERATARRKPLKSDLLSLTTEELNYSLSLFVKEVRKPNGSEYAPDTIYYLVLGIQQYLYENGRIDNIFTDLYFEQFTNCLDEVARKFSVLYNDSQYIVTRVEEEHLWECKQLGAHSPHVLLSTLMFFNTKHFNLTTEDEHLQLSFSHIMKHWKRNGGQVNKATGTRNVLLRFYPPQSALDANARKKKCYEQQENEENPLRCPVKLYEFYLSKCPESVKTRNDVFYLLPERSCVPDSPVWYSTQPLGRPALTKMLHRVKMVKEINIALLTS